MIYEAFDIVVVPFPFVDSDKSKRRPAIILSSHKNFGIQSNYSVMAIITSARNSSWPLDFIISNLKVTGLPKPSVIRMKLFTLDHNFIIEKIGTLAKKDRANLCKNFGCIFEDILHILQK